MNKILNINLGGYALTIDDDAYEYLQAYIESIRRRFSESEGRDEIVGDIEARLGEIISQNMGNRTIVMLPDVEDATAVMGKPEEFGSPEPETTSKKTGGSRPSGSSVPPIRTGKRLFRDEEDSVVAGICSGLTAYFGFKDPVWMRLAFVLMAFISFGFWVPAYLLMWILVRPAKSAADRLAMRGEPANVENIAREIEEGFERLGNKVNEMGGQAAKKGGSGAQNMMTTGVTAIGQLFGFVVRFVAKFATLIAFLIAIALFLSFGGAWIASIWTLVMAAPFVAYFSPFSSGVTWLGFANVFFLMGIPLVALALFFARVLFKTRASNWVHGGLWLFWTLNFISAIFLVSFASREYRQSSTVNKTIDLSAVNSDTLLLEGINTFAKDGDFFGFNEDDLRIKGLNLEMNNMIEISIRRSTSGRFECYQSIKARGRSREEAMDNADRTLFSMEVANNKLRIPTGLEIEQGKKWKGQKVKIVLSVPEGKFVRFDKNIYKYASADLNEYASGNDGNYISRSPDQLFEMTRGGIICADCPKMGDKNYRDTRDYEDFILEGDFKTEILEGESFRVTIDGPSGAGNMIKTIKTGDKITFTTEGKATSGLVKLTIVTPIFTSLHADNSGEITIRGFEEGHASISAKGSSQIKAYLDASSNLDLTLSGKCTLELTGKGGALNANLTNGATLEASNWRADDAEISASEGSKARVYVRNNALILSDAASTVKVDGGATIKKSRE